MRVTGAWLDNPDTQQVCKMLTDAGYQALFVGGCVRNSLLGTPVSDIDLSTDAPPQRVIALAKAAKLKAIPTGIDHGTVTVVAGGLPHEITTFRKDVETDGRRAVVAYSDSILDDARRRDFTMNALYARPDGTVIDPLDGYRDLQERRVRFIENPTLRIQEDYLRILRFFRFTAWYGDPEAGFDQGGLGAIAENLDGISTLSKERVWAELKKLLLAPDPAPAIATMRSVGALGQILSGADDRWLAVLVHTENTIGLTPNAISRLAVIGGVEPETTFRLSKSEASQLMLLRDQIGSMMPASALGFQFGATTSKQILALRAALFEVPVNTDDLVRAEQGANAVFPIQAADLMPGLSGSALGNKLKKLEERWIMSEFSLSREELLR